MPGIDSKVKIADGKLMFDDLDGSNPSLSELRREKNPDRGQFW